MAIGNYLTTEEVAERLGVTTGRVRQFHTEGRLPSVKVGPVLLFEKSAVAAFQRQDRPNGRPRKQTS